MPGMCQPYQIIDKVCFISDN